MVVEQMCARSNLEPFLRSNLDILFVGLNPANGSSDKKHYFSVKQSFWNQLYEAALITEKVDKESADGKIFGSNDLNFNKWQYGVIDLVPEIVNSDSRKVAPTPKHVVLLIKKIIRLKPKVVCLLHSKVYLEIRKYVAKNYEVDISKLDGSLGSILPKLNTHFFKVAFPHGNTVTNENKIAVYEDIKRYLSHCQ
jgi:hypothetical protein